MKRPLKVAGAALLVAASAGLLWWSISANLEGPDGAAVPGAALAAAPQPQPQPEGPQPGVPPDGWTTSRLVLDQPAGGDGEGARFTVSLGAAEEVMGKLPAWYKGLLSREIAR